MHSDTLPYGPFVIRLDSSPAISKIKSMKKLFNEAKKRKVTVALEKMKCLFSNEKKGTKKSMEIISVRRLFYLNVWLKPSVLGID